MNCVTYSLFLCQRCVRKCSNTEYLALYLLMSCFASLLLPPRASFALFDVHLQPVVTAVSRLVALTPFLNITFVNTS